jgi:FtsP/CotA-like multicopper oxidase with cupredoxin domain
MQEDPRVVTMHPHTRPDLSTTAESLPDRSVGLPVAGRPRLLELADGEALRLRIAPWMAHCHIAEHMQSGMMFSFTVARQ